MLADGECSIRPTKRASDSQGPIWWDKGAYESIWEDELRADHLHYIVNGNDGLGLNVARQDPIRSVKDVIGLEPGAEPTSQSK